MQTKEQHKHAQIVSGLQSCDSVALHFRPTAVRSRTEKDGGQWAKSTETYEEKRQSETPIGQEGSRGKTELSVEKKHFRP